MLLGAKGAAFVEPCERAGLDVWRMREEAKAAPTRREGLELLRHTRQAAQALLASEPPADARQYDDDAPDAANPVDRLIRYLERYRGWPQAEAMLVRLREAPPWLRARMSWALRTCGPALPFGELLQRFASALAHAEQIIPNSPDWWRAARAELSIDDEGRPVGDIELTPLTPTRRGGVPAAAVEKILAPLAAELRAAGVGVMDTARILALVASVSADTAKAWIR